MKSHTVCKIHVKSKLSSKPQPLHIVCEIQVAHHQMLNARKEMAGHVVVRG